MVSGTDAVPWLKRLPINPVSYNEWHALVLGPCLVATAALALLGVPLPVFAYALAVDAATLVARAAPWLPVVSEAWYLQATFKAPLLAVVVVV